MVHTIPPSMNHHSDYRFEQPALPVPIVNLAGPVSSNAVPMNNPRKSVVRAQLTRRRGAKHTLLTPILRRHRTRYSKPAPLPPRFMIPSLGVDGNAREANANANVDGIYHVGGSGTTATSNVDESNGGSSATYLNSGYYFPTDKDRHYFPTDKDRLAFLPTTPPAAARSPSPDSVMSNLSTVPTPPTVSPIAGPPNSESSSATHIRFHDVVRVKRIPARSQYPDSIKKHLWCNSKEIQANARRNAIEYAAESWDWRAATEEDKMYYSNEMRCHVHPVHVHRRQPVVRRQQRLMWQQHLKAQADKAVVMRKKQIEELEERSRREAQMMSDYRHRHHARQQQKQACIHIEFSPVSSKTRT